MTRSVRHALSLDYPCVLNEEAAEAATQRKTKKLIFTISGIASRLLMLLLLSGCAQLLARARTVDHDGGGDDGHAKTQWVRTLVCVFFHAFQSTGVTGKRAVEFG